jgi:hypothetical protein
MYAMFNPYTSVYQETTPTPIEENPIQCHNSLATMLYGFMFGYREITPQPAESRPLQRRNSYAMFYLFKHEENTPSPAESGSKRRNTIAIRNPFKRQKTTLTSTEPDGIQCRTMSKELVEEWFNTSQQSYGSRRGATISITDVLTPRFMTGEIHSKYDLDIYKKYSSIFEITNDDCILAGAKENRACHNGESKLHKLACGHYVYSKNQQLPSGSNCETRNDDGEPFFCILCGRNKKSTNKDANGISRRWHDVLLPESIEPKWEMICFEEAQMNRQVEPAYIDSHGFILVPHIHYVIAMVRA